MKFVFAILYIQKFKCLKNVISQTRSQNQKSSFNIIRKRFPETQPSQSIFILFVWQMAK